MGFNVAHAAKILRSKHYARGVEVHSDQGFVKARLLLRTGDEALLVEIFANAQGVTVTDITGVTMQEVEASMRAIPHATPPQLTDRSGKYLKQVDILEYIGQIEEDLGLRQSEKR